MNEINFNKIVRYENDVLKVKELVKFTFKQLDYYSKSGKRYNSIKSLAEIIELSRNTTSKYIKIILMNIFKTPIKANTIYDLLFGKVTTSYHDLQRKCEKLNMKLVTTPSEWFRIVKNRKQKSVQSLSIRIQFECGHETKKLIHNLNKRGCGVCSLIDNQKNLHGRLNYRQVLDLAQKRNLRLLSSSEQFEYSIKNTRSKDRKKPSDAVILWQCKKCKRVFKNRYSNVKWHGSGCLFCSIGKEQRITHLYCEYIFNQKFEINKSLMEIFCKEGIPEKLNHHNIHIDSFCILKFQDRVIKLGVEYNGLQHQNSDEGWEAFKFLSHNRCTLSDWQGLIERDKEKVNLFKKFNVNDYFLIVVPRRIRRNERFNYIIEQFKLQTGIRIEKEFKDWKTLYFTEYESILEI